MERTHNSGLGRVAVAAVSLNLVVVALLAAVLPHESQVLLPLVGLILPLLTAAGLDAYAQSDRRSPRQPSPRLTQAAPSLRQAHA